MKSLRQEKIIELVKNNQIETQEELAGLLKEAGFDVTQATVSRDIRSLKLTKVSSDDGKNYYAILNENSKLMAEDKYTGLLRDVVTQVDTGQNIIVIKTTPGMAMGLGTAIDALGWKEVLGCIAGDDTVMCVARTQQDALLISERIRQMLP